MILLEVTLFKVLRGYNISIQFDTLPNTIKLLGNELGHVIKQQAGIKYYKIVEEIRQKSKKYRSTQNEKYLNDIFNLLKNLKPEEIYVITKSFTIFFYLSNIAEQVFREHFLENKKIRTVPRVIIEKKVSLVLNSFFNSLIIKVLNIIKF